MRLYQVLDLAREFAFTLFIASLLTCPRLAQAQFDEAGEQQLIQLINQERASQGDFAADPGSASHPSCSQTHLADGGT